MKIIIWYFTGTGNTRFAAETLLEKLKNNGADATLARFYNGAQTPDFSDCDLIGLSYPVHAFNAPQPFFKAVKNADTCGKPVFVFTTSGEPLFFNDYSFLTIKRVLNKKRSKIFAAANCLMPYNIL